MAEALEDDLAPVGALQAVLARRLVVAAWRLERADRIERELFAHHAERSERAWGRLGLALVRDGNGPRAFDTLLRYRGSATAELWRALRALKALQAQAAQDEEHAPELPAPSQDELPIEPEARADPDETAPAPPADEPQAACSEDRPAPTSHAPSSHACVRAPEVTQKCAIMRHLCAINAPSHEMRGSMRARRRLPWRQLAPSCGSSAWQIVSEASRYVVREATRCPDLRHGRFLRSRCLFNIRGYALRRLQPCSSAQLLNAVAEPLSAAKVAWLGWRCKIGRMIRGSRVLSVDRR